MDRTRQIISTVNDITVLLDICFTESMSLKRDSGDDSELMHTAVAPDADTEKSHIGLTLHPTTVKQAKGGNASIMTGKQLAGPLFLYRAADTFTI
jgi:hypothetical protein